MTRCMNLIAATATPTGKLDASTIESIRLLEWTRLSHRSRLLRLRQLRQKKRALSKDAASKQSKAYKYRKSKGYAEAKDCIAPLRIAVLGSLRNVMRVFKD